MSKINTEYLGKCIATVEKSYEMLKQTNEGIIKYELYNFNDPGKHLYELNKFLCNSNIPFLIDIKEFDNLPPSFQEEIKKSYIKIEFSN